MQPFNGLTSDPPPTAALRARPHREPPRNRPHFSPDPLASSTIASPAETGADHCARLLLDTMPGVLKAVRYAVSGKPLPQSSAPPIKKSASAAAITFPQYRTLVFVDQHQGASLSELADFLGLSLPSASKLVDLLVKQGVLARQHHAEDRRRITLRLTRRGDALFKNARERVRQHLAALLSHCDAPALDALATGLGVLQASFPAKRIENVLGPKIIDGAPVETQRASGA